MKILQINSVCDFGSTGLITRELADYLEHKGCECYVAYGHGTTSFHNSMKVGGILENHFHNAFFTRLLGLHGHGTRRGTKKLVAWIEEIKPDIVHLGNLHANYLNYPILFEYLVKSRIPVVFTLHDCFNFTGKCAHYTAIGCYKWQEQCVNCPSFRRGIAPSMFFDNSKKIFCQKKYYYEKMNMLTVVAVSKWLANEAKKSRMFSAAHSISHIYNWIDSNKFHRANQDGIDAFRRKYDLSADVKYLISASQVWDCKSSRYKDAVKLAERLPAGYKLILIGGVSRGTTIDAPVLYIPYINGFEELSAAYSMAEAYVHLSVEDTFGKVIAEAMSCGTVPITFDSTACGEVPGPYGIVVKPHDIDTIVNSLPRLESLKQVRKEMVQYVHDNYDYRTNAQKYLDLYSKINAGEYK